MIHWRSGTVVSVDGGHPGTRTLTALLDDGTEVPALALTGLVGDPGPGDRVLLNCSALLRGLGTGGQALVVAVPERLPADPPQQPGHIVKGRYSPLQTMVLALEEQESPHHEALRSAPDGLDGMPVVVAELHSALPAVLAGLRTEAPDARVVYVMTDSGALPMAYSRTVQRLVAAGWLQGTVTAGQAWGGEHEAISVHSALHAARHVLGADLVVVTQGPGNAGSGTTWGFSGIAAGDALNAAYAMDGRAVAALRVSGADRRARHHGLSHHSVTTLERVALGDVDVVLPVLTGELAQLGAQVRDAVLRLVAGARGRPTVCEVQVDGLLGALMESPVSLRTMGRGLADDPAVFLTTAAAGRYAARLLR